MVDWMEALVFGSGLKDGWARWIDDIAHLIAKTFEELDGAAIRNGKSLIHLDGEE